MEFTPSHVGICVSDLDRSLRFYRDGLGFEPTKRYAITSETMPGLEKVIEVDGPVSLVSQFLQRGEVCIELLWYPDRAPTGTPAATRAQLGLTHLSFLVDDIEKAAAVLVEHGATILDHTRPGGGAQLLFLADPDGTRVELMGRAQPSATGGS
jgi:catechol 2,3-dioxygenase-like lactoylglutathione lyase family enzyme